jgi:hypothetical protein
MSALLLGAAVAACSGTLDPAMVAGNWSKMEPIPENSVSMTLTTSGSRISGTGNWCGEALGCGTLTVSGMVTGDLIHLDFVYSNGVIEHFDGRVRAYAILEGSARGEVPGQPPQLPHGATFRVARDSTLT